MKRRTFSSLVMVAAVISAPVSAHHSTNGIYDESEIVEITGTVSEWRFVNPHPSLVLMVSLPGGGLQEWDVSYGGSAVTHLRRRGYSADTFQPGDVIVVRGFAALVDTAYGLLVRSDPVREDGSPVISAGQ